MIKAIRWGVSLSIGYPSGCCSLENSHSVHGEQPMSSTAIYIVIDDYGGQTRYGPYATMQEAEAVRAEFLAKRVAARIIEVEEED